MNEASPATRLMYESQPLDFSDDNLALIFAAENKDEFRYVAAWNRWFRWDGKRWTIDDTLAVLDRARFRCRMQAARCDTARAAQIASAKTVAAVLSLARSDPLLVATVDQWDRDPMMLNTPEGLVDLRTGEMYPHQPEDYCTKITAVGPGGDCPLWLEFLRRITGGNTGLQAFLARVFGYAATGSTKEHALFFNHGTGSNGKSVLLNTISNVLGNYAQTAPIETFTASIVERHPTEIADLRGSRLVIATETEEGRRWAEARIKMLTGGDPVRARFMRQDYFEFTPAFKLVIAGNHKPSLRSVDEAIRRRFNLIPFTVTIPAEERDPDLAAKLKAEWPGILAWMIDGCRMWQAHGLRPPRVVTDATAAYLESEDSLMTWMGERCQLDPNAWASSSELFEDWKDWATRTGEPSGTLKHFSQQIEAQGFSRRKRSTGNGFSGLQLIPRMVP